MLLQQTFRMPLTKEWHDKKGNFVLLKENKRKIMKLILAQNTLAFKWKNQQELLCEDYSWCCLKPCEVATCPQFVIMTNKISFWFFIGRCENFLELQKLVRSSLQNIVITMKQSLWQRIKCDILGSKIVLVLVTLMLSSTKDKRCIKQAY